MFISPPPNSVYLILFTTLKYLTYVSDYLFEIFSVVSNYPHFFSNNIKEKNNHFP